jgi:hypothetical protein
MKELRELSYPAGGGQFWVLPAEDQTVTAGWHCGTTALARSREYLVHEKPRLRVGPLLRAATRTFRWRKG